jgi:hypothetical protein
METWRHGDMETWRYEDMETWRHGDIDMETWKHGGIGDIRRKTENKSQGNFPKSVYRLLIVQTEVCRLRLVRLLTTEFIRLQTK